MTWMNENLHGHFYKVQQHGFAATGFLFQQWPSKMLGNDERIHLNPQRSGIKARKHIFLKISYSILTILNVLNFQCMTGSYSLLIFYSTIHFLSSSSGTDSVYFPLPKRQWLRNGWNIFIPLCNSVPVVNPSLSLLLKNKTILAEW